MLTPPQTLMDFHFYPRFYFEKLWTKCVSLPSTHTQALLLLGWNSPPFPRPTPECCLPSSLPSVCSPLLPSHQPAQIRMEGDCGQTAANEGTSSTRLWLCWELQGAWLACQPLGTPVKHFLCPSVGPGFRSISPSLCFSIRFFLLMVAVILGSLYRL